MRPPADPLLTGMIIAHQSFDDQLKQNPNFHAIVLEGGFDDEGTFFFIPFTGLQSAPARSERSLPVAGMSAKPDHFHIFRQSRRQSAVLRLSSEIILPAIKKMEGELRWIQTQLCLQQKNCCQGSRIISSERSGVIWFARSWRNNRRQRH